MYNGEAWDKVYMKHLHDAPWMTDACINIYSHIIDKYLPNELATLRVLDYGCGSGKLTYRLKQKGAFVDLAEISRYIIDWLKQKYKNCGVNIYEVEYPQQLSMVEPYDIILAWMFFCNISPDLWDKFLCGFYEIMKPGACLIIGGWDEEDSVNKNNGFIIPFTNQRAWPINTLRYRLGKKFEAIYDEKILIDHPFYKEPRTFRCFKLNRNY